MKFLKFISAVILAVFAAFLVFFVQSKKIEESLNNLTINLIFFQRFM